MNLCAFFVLVHLGHLNIVQVIVLFRLFCSSHKALAAQPLSIKLFGGRDSIFGRAAILNFDHTEKAQ